MQDPKHKVVVLSHNQTIEVSEKRNLLEQLLENNIPVKSSCGGVASCRDCIVKIVKGKENINPAPFQEKNIMGNVFFLTKERLSCQLKVLGDIEIVID